MIGRWAYRRLMGTCLTLATLTVTLAVAALTIWAPGQLAGVALATLEEPRGAESATDSLTELLERGGLAPEAAHGAAAAAVNDPALREALATAEASGDTSALPAAVAAAVAPYSAAASDELTRKVASLLDLSAAPSQGAQAGREGWAASAGSFSAAGPSLSLSEGARPAAWARAHSSVLVGVGAALAVVGVGAVLLFARARRAQTVGLTGRWALALGALPLLGVYVMVPLAGRLDLYPVVHLVLVAAPKLFGAAVPLWTALAAAGVAGMVVSAVWPAGAGDRHAASPKDKGARMRRSGEGVLAAGQGVTG